MDVESHSSAVFGGFLELTSGLFGGDTMVGLVTQKLLTSYISHPSVLSIGRTRQDLERTELVRTISVSNDLHFQRAPLTSPIRSSLSRNARWKSVMDGPAGSDE